MGERVKTGERYSYNGNSRIRHGVSIEIYSLVRTCSKKVREWNG